MGCESCMKEWVEAKKGECPYCRKTLKAKDLVNCSSLAKEIHEVIHL
jgi:hypothetical protein